jgi:sugar phosphate isomerase/epimerase
MNLCVFTVPYYHLSLEDTLKKLSALGVQSVELGSGGYPGSGHLDVTSLLESDEAISAVKNILHDNNMRISALSCHGNPVHPDPTIAHAFDMDFRKTVRLAQRLGVETIVTFSGCPGDHPGAKYPNWVTCPWPEDFLSVLNYQWEDVLIPYWTEAADFAKSHGIKKIALEMHPGFNVYNPETLLRLRGAVGDIIGANFDPSHLFWQGIDPVAAIRALEGAIYHVHAKDTRIDPLQCSVNGVLDTKNYGLIKDRSWVFRTVGYGHDQRVWNDIISALRIVGYDGAISIEHEDGLMSIEEGMTKAIKFLHNTLIFETVDGMWWA